MSPARVLAVLLPLALLVGCPEPDPDPDPVDADGDGFDTTVDCDDGDATIHPDAVEVVDDGIDQDCTGTDSVTCQADGDGDGFGSTDTVVSEDSDCLDDGESGVSADCDDASASVFPGADETADDGVDQDCNGFDTVTCQLDADGDGAGVADTVLADDGDCTDPGEADSADDCDDDDALSFPGAAELCDDTADNDCDGPVDCADTDDCRLSPSCAVLFGADGKGGFAGNLYTIDPMTGESQIVGAIGAGVTGMAFAPDGTLYAVESTEGGDFGDSRLLVIDPLTATATEVGPLLELSGARGDEGGEENHQSVPDITFAGTRLIAWTENGDDPAEIDPTTGEVTVLGDGTSSAGSGLAARDGIVLVAPDGPNGPLWVVDIVEGSVTEGPDLTPADDIERLDEINSMTFVGPNLLGVEANEGFGSFLILIDSDTGMWTRRGTIPGAIDAIASRPPPGGPG